MKKRFNLFKFAENDLKQKEKKSLRAGTSCACGCAYVNCGGSSSDDNAIANCEDGRKSRDYTPVC